MATSTRAEDRARQFQWFFSIVLTVSVAVLGYVVNRVDAIDNDCVKKTTLSIVREDVRGTLGSIETNVRELKADVKDVKDMLVDHMVSDTPNTEAHNPN